MLSDLRFTFRALAKAPGFALLAVFTLALGIGVNTTMFSIVNTVLFSELPYERPEELVSLNITRPQEGDRMDLSMDEFRDVRSGMNSFVSVFASQSGTFNVSGGDLAPERFTGTWFVGPGLQTLGMKPQLGRVWTETEDVAGAEPVVVISETLWRNRFGADPAVLGKTLRVNGEVATIIGVADSDFNYPDTSDLWVPRRYSREGEERDTRYLDTIARLRPGVSIEQARQEFEVMFNQWAQSYPKIYDKEGVDLLDLHDDFVGDGTKQMLGVMMTCVTMVLLIACTNVANLLLVRGAARSKELAVRTALGAGRGRTVRLLLLESLVLALAGALVALPLAWGQLQLFARAMANSGEEIATWMSWEIDDKVLGYVALLSVFTCLVAGLMPAVRLGRSNLVSFLNDASRGSTGVRSGKLTRMLVVFEVAMSCVLLTLSGLMIRSVVNSASIPLGYEPSGIMTCRIGLPEAQYVGDDVQVAFFESLQRNLSQRADVAAAGLSSRLPTWDGRNYVELEDSPLAGGASQPLAGSGFVSPGWFKTLGVEMVAGRDFERTDTRDRDPVAVVNQLMAERFWPGENAVGKRFKLGRTEDVVDEPWVTVVGIVPSVYQGDFEDPLEPQVYLAMTQNSTRYYSLFLRATNPDPAAAAVIMREEVRRLDPDLPIYWVQPLQKHLDQALFFNRLFAWIFGLFGGVALILAVVGIYGVMAYSVNQRTQEIGVRMALGASPGSVLALILRQGGIYLGVGMVVGIGLAVPAGHLLGRFLYDVQPADPASLAGTVLVLLLSGACACAIPAWRALRVSPMEALRLD